MRPLGEDPGTRLPLKSVKLSSLWRRLSLAFSSPWGRTEGSFLPLPLSLPHFSKKAPIESLLCCSLTPFPHPSFKSVYCLWAGHCPFAALGPPRPTFVAASEDSLTFWLPVGFDQLGTTGWSWKGRRRGVWGI